MDKSKVELKVGVFVFAALVILGIFVFKIGNLKTYGRGYSIKLLFNNVSGVKTGSPVRFSGVDVGEVNQVNILAGEQYNNARVEIIAWIREALYIPDNSAAYINTLGLLGEKYIEIVPPSEYTTFLKAGDTLVGTDPIMMRHWIDEGEKVIEDFQEIIRKLKEGEGTIGKLLYDDKLYQELEALVSDLQQAKRGTIGKLLYDDRLYQELEALVSDLRNHPWKLFWKTTEKEK